MMMRTVASKIVRDCVRFACGEPDREIFAQHKLKSVGIVDEFLIQNLINQIVGSTERGVPSVGFSINPNDLIFSGDTKVHELRDLVVENALETEEEG